MDEAGFSLTPVVRKTWAVRGHTPTFKHAWGPYARVSAISGITTDQRLFFQLLKRRTFKGPDVARFLRLLLRHIPGNVLVIWDGGAQHRSKAALQVAAQNPRLELVRLPAYCPELNPDENVWNHAKNVELAGRAPANEDELTIRVRSAMRSLKRSPSLLESFLNASELPWTRSVA